MRHTGRTDVPLTDAGRETARSLAGRLAEPSFGRVLVSPLARARETSELAGFGAQAEPRDELLEWDYGEYEGLTTEAIRATRPDWFLWRDGCPGGESVFDVARRVDRLVDALLAEEQPSLIFAHGHVLRVLGARWIGLPPGDGALLFLNPASVSVLGFERAVRVLRRWNG